MSRTRFIMCAIGLILLGVIVGFFITHVSFKSHFISAEYRSNHKFLHADFNGDGKYETIIISPSAAGPKELIVLQEGREFLRTPYNDFAKEPFRNTKVAINTEGTKQHLLVLRERNVQNVFEYSGSGMTLVNPSEKENEIFRSMSQDFQ